MLYEVLYSGERIDEILEAIGHIKSVLNGWVKLESTKESPIDFTTLINPGNFSFDYWISGPNVNLASPIKAIITKEGKYIRQYVFTLGYNTSAYTRTYEIGSMVFSPWELVGLNKGLTTGNTAPTNPKANDIWINTSNKGAVIQYYDANTNSWVPLNPYDYMDPEVYNPDDTKFPRGIYQYIDQRVKNVNPSGGETSIDFNGHINNANIHVTKDEKAIFDNKMTSDSLLTAMNKLANELKLYTSNKISGSGIDVSAIQLLVDQLTTSWNNHIKNNVKHPSAEQRANWDSKADKNHTHDISQITLDVSDVTGTIPISLIPDDAKERQVSVTTEEQLLALTVKEVQNGDFIYFDHGDNKSEVLIVIDQTKLGSRDAFLSYSVPGEEITWDKIQGKPTTFEGLGITDVVSNERIDHIKTELDQTSSTTKTNMDALTSKLNIDKQDKSFMLENLIDLIDAKMQLVTELVDEVTLA